MLDASVAAVWLFDDESNDYAELALRRLEQEGAVVPQLWHSEIRNCLLVAERRNRIDESDAVARLEALIELPIETDPNPDLDAAYTLARKYDLSFYDALYVELASRLHIPLATLDRRLSAAASSTAGENLPPL